MLRRSATKLAYAFDKAHLNASFLGLWCAILCVCVFFLCLRCTICVCECSGVHDKFKGHAGVLGISYRSFAAPPVQVYKLLFII